jgi:hypothetical protein
MKKKKKRKLDVRTLFHYNPEEGGFFSFHSTTSLFENEIIVAL